MISERSAARYFGSLWRHIFPMLTPSFMRIFNASYVRKLESECAFRNMKVGPVQKQYHSPDFISELAIQLAKEACLAGLQVDALKEEGHIVAGAWRAAQAVVEKYEGTVGDTVLGFTFSEAAFKEALAISKNIEAVSIALSGLVQFFPSVRGAGVIRRCEADLAIGCHLVEVKAVDRRFMAKDLKQLLVYLALDATDKRRWQKGCILNPRMGTWCRFDVEELVQFLSAGESSAVAFSNLLDGLNRDVEIDALF